MLKVTHAKRGKCGRCGKTHRRQITVTGESDLFHPEDAVLADLHLWGENWSPDFTCRPREKRCMAEYREGLPERPRRIRALPLDERGYPVPWFVAWIDGKPDFRVIDRGKPMLAWEHRVCWLCGQPLGRYVAFVIGPMCSVNRISSEPPSHRECALYAAQACPFLTRPGAKRRDAGLPENAQDPAGIMLEHNPGLCIVWVTKANAPRGPRLMKVSNGYLFHVGDPTELYWLTEGRNATRAEIDEAIERGLPALRSAAEADGPEAIKAMDQALAGLEALLAVPDKGLANQPSLI